MLERQGSLEYAFDWLMLRGFCDRYGPLKTTVLSSLRYPISSGDGASYYPSAIELVRYTSFQCCASRNCLSDSGYDARGLCLHEDLYLFDCCLHGPQRRPCNHCLHRPRTSLFLFCGIGRYFVLHLYRFLYHFNSECASARPGKVQHSGIRKQLSSRMRGCLLQSLLSLLCRLSDDASYFGLQRVPGNVL